jgi:hypothetical protein
MAYLVHMGVMNNTELDNGILLLLSKQMIVLHADFNYRHGLFGTYGCDEQHRIG